MTGEQLKNICPNLGIDKANGLAILITELAIKYNCNTPKRLQAFVAQIAHESGEFSIRLENMNYTTPSRIVSIWSTRFNLDGSGGKLNANNFIRNPQKLANSVYANRMGNGNAESGDGFTFRGSGYLQLTGRDSYKQYADYLKIDIKEVANLVQTTDRYALDSAFWEFCINKSLLDEADKEDFVTITKRINGGLIGYDERVKYYNRAKKYIVTI